MEITTTDCGFPFTIESEIYAILWEKMLFESQREIDYMADLAGIRAGISVGGTSLNFNHWSYNDNVENYLQEIFKNVQHFETDETFFNNLKSSELRNARNDLQVEPFSRLAQ